MNKWTGGWEVGGDMVPEWNPGLLTIGTVLIIFIGSLTFIGYNLWEMYFG